MKSKFEHIFKKDLSGLDTILLFGNDDSTITRAAEYIESKWGQSSVFSEKEFLDKAILQTPSLFDNLDDTANYLVQNIGEKSLSKIKEFHGESSKLLLTSTKLRANSKVTKFVEESGSGLIVPCYEESLKRDEFDHKMAEFSIDPEIRNWIYQECQMNPDLLSQIVSILHILSSQDIAHQEVLSPLLENATASCEDLSWEFLLCQRDKVIRSISEQDSSEQIAFIRQTLRRMILVYQVRTFGLDKGKLSTPIFFKEEGLYRNASSQWTLKALNNAITRILSQETKIKSGDSKQLDALILFYMERSLS